MLGERVPAPDRSARKVEREWERAMTGRMAASLLTALCDLAAQRYGIPPSTLLRAAALDPEDVRDPGAMLPEAAFYQLLRTLRAHTDDPGLGVHLAAPIDLRTQGFWGYALLSSETFGQRLEVHVRYQRLRSPVELSLSMEGDTAILSAAPRSIPADVMPLVFDFGLTSGLMHLRANLAGDTSGVRLAVGYPERPHHRALRALLVEPVVFDAPCTQLRFPAAALGRKLHGDPHLGALANAQLDTQLRAARDAECRELPDEVRHRLRERLHRDASLEAVARDFRVSARTLQRQLGARGLSFQGLVEDVRRSQALHYVTQTDEAVERIAEKLGYGDASSFRRAFRRWTGLAPASYRAERSERRELSKSVGKLAPDARMLAGKGPAA